MDLTPPIAGLVVDGDLPQFKDKVFSSSKSTVNLQWKDFYDPESGIREYKIDVLRKRLFIILCDTNFVQKWVIR